MRGILTAAVLAMTMLSSGCMMSSAGVRQWNGERVANELAAIQSRVAAGDEGARAQAAVDVFAVSRQLQGGYLSDWWAMAKDQPWPVIWRGVADLVIDAGGVWLGAQILPDNNKDDKTTTPTTIPQGTEINGDFVSIQAGGDVRYEKTEMAGE